VLTSQRDKLEELAGLLIEKETVEREEFEALFEDESPLVTAAASVSA
jgi:ATP-dependent Zn protease